MLTEIKTLMTELNSRMESTEERISEVEYRTIKITQYKQKRKKRLKKMNVCDYKI